MDIWKTLGLEPTQDVSAIRRAYAEQARSCHPEEDPEGFLQLREAYQKALTWAEGKTAPAARPPAPQQAREEPDRTEAREPEEPQGWFLREEAPDDGPNPYADHQAVRQFLELYTGKQRKNSKSWLDYFTSAPFLEVFQKERFTALLLEHVTRLEEEFPPPREFLTWLYVAYRFTGHKTEYPDRTEVRFEKYQGADFDGLESILQIARRGPIPKQAAGNELSVLTSFQEYRHLLQLAERGDWNERAMEELSHILGRYVLSYLQDRCDPKKSMEYQRHPAGFRVITHFFVREDLPEELYRLAWQKLDLKSAVMGRPKVVYGRLREIVLERAPQIQEEAPERFFQLRLDFTPYAISCYHQGGRNEPEDKERTDAFFAREDFRRALLNRQFVEQDILHTWVDEDRCDYYLERIIDFYTQHPGAPYREKVIQRARQMLALRACRRRTEEDREAPVPEGIPSLRFRPFFRHWLNTGFYRARSPESGQPLSIYLQEHLPHLPQWSRRFLGAEEGGIPAPRILTRTLFDVEIQVRLHLRYIDYRVNGEDPCQPFLEWEALDSLTDPEEFFLLLPAAAAAYTQYEAVKSALLARLASTAAPQENWDEIAAALAGQVCCLPLREDGSLAPPMEALPVEWFQEDGERLLGCSWSPADEALNFFEQTAAGRRPQRDGFFEEVFDFQTASDLAQRLLEDAISPTSIHLELLENLPTAVYVEPDFMVICRDPARLGADLPRQVLGQEVTRQALAEFFNHFAAGRIKRLELSWPTGLPAWERQEYEPRRSLVFLHESAGWACLYFDDFKAQICALVSRWELYLRADTNAPTFVSFHQGRLHSYDVHPSFSTIRRHLDTVFRQASWPNGIDLHAGNIWSYAVFINHGRHKYNLDKRLLGGFPLEWSYNRPTAKFYLSDYPDLAVWTDGKGQREALELNTFNRDRLQQALAGFMGGGCAKLCLTWGREPGRQRHIAMVQDQGRFLLAWLLDEKQQAQFHVADVPTYLDVEGKKYPKDTFRNRVTPAYLIHSGMQLRGALEQLLACIEEPTRFTGKFAEFAPESPVKPRPYPVLRAELVD